MDNQSLIEAARACHCARGRRELKAVVAQNLYRARPKVRMTNENFNRMFVALPDGHYCEIACSLYFDLVRHWVFGEWHYPARRPDDTECMRCRLLPVERNQCHFASSPLSVGGSMSLCGNCALDLGVDLPPGWPRCDDCARPFATVTAGEAAFGAWVSPIADGESLCGACWLASVYQDDRNKMMEHATNKNVARVSVDIAFQLGQSGLDIVDTATMTLFASPGLLELLRVGAIGVVEAATFIRRRAVEIGMQSPAREPAMRVRHARWRDEQREPGIKLQRVCA